LNNELIKYGGKPLSEQLANLYQKILNETTIPTDWMKCITIPIFKTGDKKPGNYRGITPKRRDETIHENHMRYNFRTSTHNGRTTGIQEKQVYHRRHIHHSRNQSNTRKICAL